MLPPATIPAHPPPPSESMTTSSPEQQQQPPPPPAPPSGVESEAPPKRRKVEEVGFQRSPYYTIRETVANLRGCVLQVCQGTDSQKKDAAVEILKEMKDVMELSKKARLDLSSAAEPVKPFDKPAARAPEDKPAGNVPSAEKSQVPPISLAGNFVHSIGGDVPIKPDNSDTAAHMLLVETKKGPRPIAGLHCSSAAMSLHEFAFLFDFSERKGKQEAADYPSLLVLPLPKKTGGGVGPRPTSGFHSRAELSARLLGVDGSNAFWARKRAGSVPARDWALAAAAKTRSPVRHAEVPETSEPRRRQAS
ncbi:hypothetical protein C2845_PM15G17370 [Panicum miliaceum]|uniref:Uncharacterized protein n=1 Tax=Panicum miliaceum TaxID=4540 RepID=A0A3L6Q7H9_PANMI|nr:hypothetical protein C2845_PM15G17370 [Panicum miliaceum]